MKKLFLTILTTLLITSAALAMPGFSSYIPDQAGEFVYYRDYSFERESYIGILAYDSKSYQLRYYAPAGKQPLKVIATLVTVDFVNNHFDLTGEKILIADYNNPEDVDIINYLHDLMYEFAARRISIFEVNPNSKGYVNFDSLKTNGIYESSEFSQFGGNVNILYDCIIPFFNIKRIEDEKGKALFECVELGKIKSSEDTLFDEVHVFPEKNKVKQNSKKVSKTNPVEFAINGQKIMLDNTWQEKLDYMWVLNDEAIITMMTYTKDGAEKDNYYYQYYLLRSFLQCKDNTFVDYKSSDVTFTDKGFRLYSDTHSPAIKKVYYTVKSITENKNADYDYMSFAATRGSYLIRKTYFDSILKSYSNY